MEILIKTKNDSLRGSDHNDYTATASRAGLTGHGYGYSEQTAIARAKESLIKKEMSLSPVTPNWENSIESFLCRD